MFADILQLPHAVISAVSNRARSKRRQTIIAGNVVLPQQLFQHFKHISLAPFHAPAPLHLDLLTPRRHPHVGLRPQERIASDALTPFDRFEEEGFRLPGCNGKKCRNWRQQISRHRLNHRNQRRLASPLRKLLIIGTNHSIS